MSSTLSSLSLITVLALSAPIGLTAASAQDRPGPYVPTLEGQTTMFGCDAPAGHACSFAVVSRNGAARSFGLRGGQKTAVPRTEPGIDYYFVSIDRPAPSNQPACAVILKAGGFCKGGVVNAQYNN